MKRADEFPALDEFLIVARQFQHRPAAIHLLHGHSSAYRAGLVLGVATGQPVAIIDGAMRFNSYHISDIAKHFHLPPRNVLRRIHVTRSFTAFQTEAALTVKLLHFLSHTACPLVIILGLLDTYYDDQIKPQECRQSLERIMQTTHHLTRQHTHILIVDVQATNPPLGKESLFQLVHTHADSVFLLTCTDNGFHLLEERRTNTWDATTTPSRLSSKSNLNSGTNFAEV